MIDMEVMSPKPGFTVTSNSELSSTNLLSDESNRSATHKMINAMTAQKSKYERILISANFRFRITGASKQPEIRT